MGTAGEPTTSAERVAAYQVVLRRSLILGPLMGLVWAALAIAARGVYPAGSWNERYGMFVVAGVGLAVWGVGLPLMAWRLLRRERRRP